MVTDVFSDTMTLEYGDLRKGKNLTCYIVKDEMVYFAEETGRVGYFFTEGDMVRKGSAAVTLTPDETVGDTSLYVDYNRRVNSFKKGNAFLADLNKESKSLSEELNARIGESSSEEDKKMLRYYLSEINSVGSKATGFTLSENEEPPSGDMGINNTYETYKSGIISYQFDGYESEFNPSTMRLLDKEALSKIKDGFFNFSTGTTKKGEPLFKIVNNRNWYVVTWISENELGYFNEGADVTLEFGDTDVAGTIESVIDHDSEIMLIISCSSYYASLSNVRSIKANVITSDDNGLIVRNEFLTSKNRQVSVEVLNVDGSSKFVPVKVLSSDGKSSLIQSGSFYKQDENGNAVMIETVKVYDEISKPEQTAKNRG